MLSSTRPGRATRRRSRRSIRDLLNVCASLVGLVAACGVAAQTASAAAPVAVGSTLEQSANLPFGCEARPYPGLNGITFLQTNVTSCQWWQSGVSPASTYIPRGQGTLIGARVKVGANPAPLRISIISSGGGLCCTAQFRSDVFTPAPNAITTVPLSLPAGSGADPNRFGSQYNDIAVVTAVGPGSLPVHDYGQHDISNLSLPAAAFLHPELVPNNSNTDVGYMAGYEVLLQVLWCGTAGTGTSATGARLQVGDCPVPPVVVTPVTPTPVPPVVVPPTAPASLSAAQLTARVKKGKAAVQLRCGPVACAGTLVLRKPGKPTLLGRKAAFAIAAGAQAPISVTLTSSGAAALKKKSKVAADVFVTFADAHTQTFRVTLK